jgi:hypothetical protein
MIVSDMILRLRDIMDDDVAPYETKDSEMFAWLNDAYLRIQMTSTRWSFLHKRGLLATLAPGQSVYSTAVVREVVQRSMYLIRDGETAHLPLCFIEYEDWAAEEAAAPETAGTPRYVMLEPGDKWRFSPTPDDTYTFYGDARFYPDGFSGTSDEPIWDELYHDLVWLEALKIGGPRCELELYRAQIEAELGRLPGLYRNFCQRYLPRTVGAAAIV